MRFFTLLLLLANTTLSFALGLGDIELKSHLGEPLLAKINVSDAGVSPESSCFSVTDASDVPAFRDAFITIKQDNENQLLNITTKEVITELIVNLRISFHCEPNISREYVLLLDPTPLMSAEKFVIAENQASNFTDKVKSQTPKSASQVTSENVTAPTESSLDKPAQKKRSENKKVSAVLLVDKKLIGAYTGKQTTAITTEPILKDKIAAKLVETHATTDKPYLVVSGGSTSSNENAAKPDLPPNLKTQIDFVSSDTATALPAAIDAVDEMSMMTNRLAHLEKQILTLQTRNTQLLTEAEEAKYAGFNLSAQLPKWLQNLLVALGMVATLTGAEWLRRKFLRNRLNKEQPSWFDVKENAVVSDESTLVQSSNQSQNSGIFKTTAFTESENILDNADVFIAHGRPALAIQLLQNHLEEFPTESPEIWLKLLDLLAKEGFEAEYDHAMIECNQFFNINMPSFIEAAIEDKSTIENFPHIVTRLKDVWGSPLAVEFLNDLIHNQRSQPREGFERGTFEELFFLKKIAEIYHPSNKSNQQSTLYQPDVIKPALEKTPLNQTMFADVEPLDDRKIARDSNPNASELQRAIPFSTKEFSNSPDAKIYDNNVSSTAISSLDAKISSYEPVPPHKIYTLLEDIDEALDVKKTPADSKLNSSTDSPMLEVDPTFQVDEMDFSISADEIDTESALEINVPDEEIIFDSDNTATQNIKSGPPENIAEAKSSAEKQNFLGSPIREIDQTFLADEIDFSIPEDWIDTESALEINVPDKEIIFKSDNTATQNIKKGQSENITEAKSSAEKQNFPNIIEWDIPKLNKE